MRIKWKNVATAVALIMSLALVAWFAVSWTDVILHQTTGSISGWNAFPIIMQWLGH